MRVIFLFFLLISSIQASDIDIAKKLFVNKKYEESFTTFNKVKNNTEAKYFLGVMYFDGLGVEKNITKALSFSKQAAEEGDAGAMINLGDYYTSEKEFDKAIDWYKKAIESKDKLGYKLIANIYNYYLNDYEKAIDWYKKAIEHGDSSLYKNIGLIYSTKLHDDKKALENYLLYEETNNDQDNNETILVSSMLGAMYLNGDGTEKDEIIALSYFNKGARLGNIFAMRQMAGLYSMGKVVKKDYTKSLNWYQKAIEHGDSSAYKYIGNIYFYDLKNYDKALKNYLKYLQTNKGDIDIYRGIFAIYFEKQNFKKVYEYAEKAALLGDVQSMTILPDIASRIEGSLSDGKTAKQWLEKASDMNNSIAIDLLAGKTKFCGKEYIENKSKAYKLGNIDAGCDLASCSFSNSKDENFFKAYSLFNDIIEKNPDKKLLSCYSNLSYLYENGLGVAENINKSIELHKISYKNDKHRTDLTPKRIAKLYLEKLLDYKNAQKWYKVAYDLSNNIDYLYRVDKYKNKTIGKYIDGNKTTEEQKIFPIINNFYGTTQILGQTGGTNIEIISTNQKSINIYDDQDWTLKKELRGWMGHGIMGSVSTMALDDKKGLLYCTGINSKIDFSKNDIIRIFDINTGKIVKTIRDKKIYVPSALLISEDGKYLVALNKNRTELHIIDIDTESQQIYRTSHGKFYGGRIVKKDDDYLVYMSDNNNFLNIFSINKKRQIQRKKIYGSIESVSEKYFLVKEPTKKISLFDFELNKVNTLILDKTLLEGKLAISPDAKNILSVKDKKVIIFNIKNKKIIKTISSDYPIYGAYISENNIIYIRNSHNQIAYNLNTNIANKLFSENMNSIKKLNFNNNKLLIQNSDNNRSKIFDFEKLSLSTSHKIIDYSRKDTSGFKVHKENNETKIVIYDKLNNQNVSTIDYAWTKILNYKIIDDQYIVVTTEDIEEMHVFNIADGRVLASLHGFSSVQNNILYKNGYLFTYGSDNIVHIWNFDDLDIINFSKKKYDKKIAEFFARNTNNEILLRFIQEDNVGNEFMDELLKKSQDSSPSMRLSYEILLTKKKNIFPLASLYIKENDWIIYNNEGLFASSEKGKNLIRYHINQGLTKEARIVENEQIFEKLYRPDLIRKILAKVKVSEVINVRSIVLNIKPPISEIVSYKLLDKKNLELTYKVCDAGSGVSNISLVINGIEKSLRNSRGFTFQPIQVTKERCKVLQDIITLEPGKNSVALQAFDKEKIISNRSSEIVLNANYKIKKKPHLYFVSIAVSDYKTESLKLKYPVKDVLAVESAIKKKGKNIFSNIHTYRLLDENTTKINLKTLFDEISRKVEISDVFILYLAGHGVTNEKDGLFYFLPYDTENTSSSDLSASAISVNEIKSQLSKINTNKFLILLDTCNSGSFIDNANMSDDTLSRLSYRNKRNYIVASSKTQVALEGYKNHGIFTYAVLDAFDRAYFPGDKFLSVAALADYVEKNVPKITKKEFHYEQMPQTYLSGEKFPIVEKQE